ncbi:hypothetical protein JCM11251_000460 [Rhodosporidiobolus azoricus]
MPGDLFSLSSRNRNNSAEGNDGLPTGEASLTPLEHQLGTTGAEPATADDEKSNSSLWSRVKDKARIVKGKGEDDDRHIGDAATRHNRASTKAAVKSSRAAQSDSVTRYASTNDGSKGTANDDALLLMGSSSSSTAVNTSGSGSGSYDCGSAVGSGGIYSSSSTCDTASSSYPGGDCGGGSSTSSSCM